MKNLSILLLTTLLLTFANFAFAFDARSCETQGDRLNGAGQITVLQSCLDQINSPAYVQEIARTHRQTLCEQNAKNMNFVFGKKDAYVQTCMNKNDAETLFSKYSKSSS